MAHHLRSCSDIIDNNNKPKCCSCHCKWQVDGESQPSVESTAAPAQRKRTKGTRSNKLWPTEEHIYENLQPAGGGGGGSDSVAEQQRLLLRKYFRREAIYENLCRGCGYGVFGAQGHYCHFCQCIVNGVVSVSQETTSTPTPIPTPTPTCSTPSPSEGNIYENICEHCRSIYSDCEQCACNTTKATEAAAAKATTATPTSAPTATTITVSSKKSSSAGNGSLTRRGLFHNLFGSLKQLNRSASSSSASSASLQRRKQRLFQREAGKATGGGSLEIIHNVDEVFRTQETFDLGRICELKRLQSSHSEQHIYGRLKCHEEREEKQAPIGILEGPSLHQQVVVVVADKVEEPQQQQQQPPPSSAKKPRISRIRLLRSGNTKPAESVATLSIPPAPASPPPPAPTPPPPSALSPLTASSLYLNESICLWMSMLRYEQHSYEDASSLALSQQPKRIPSTYEQQQQQQQQQYSVETAVTLRREQSSPPMAHEQRLVLDFKSNLLAKMKLSIEREEKEDGEAEVEVEVGEQREEEAAITTTLLTTDTVQLRLAPSTNDRRRCGINEHHDSAFVSEFLSSFDCISEMKEEPTMSLPLLPTNNKISSSTTRTTITTQFSHISLFALLQSAALAASLHLSVVGWERTLVAFLRAAPQHTKVRSGSSSSRERLMRLYRRYVNRANNGYGLSESVVGRTVLSATPKSDDVAVAWRDASDKQQRERGYNNNNNNNKSDSANDNQSLVKVGGTEVGYSDDRISSGDSVALLMAASKPTTVSEVANDNDKVAVQHAPKCGNMNGQQQRCKVKRPAPQVPVRNPSTALSTTTAAPVKPRIVNRQLPVAKMKKAVKAMAPMPVPVPVPASSSSPMTHAELASHEAAAEKNNNNNSSSNNNNDRSIKHDEDNNNKKELVTNASCKDQQQQQQEDDDEEESIYQPIWKFKTLGEAQEYYEVPLNEADEDEDDDDDEDDGEEEDEAINDDEDDRDADDKTAIDFHIITRAEADDAAAATAAAAASAAVAAVADDDAAALQAAAAFAAGARQKSSHRSSSMVASKSVSATPLPSPTASTDQGAWETDDEFMFATQSQFRKEQQQPPEGEANINNNNDTNHAVDDTLSMGSTVTNSTATLGSISSQSSGSSAPTHVSLTHPVLRNICIVYSQLDPKKFSVIFYEYQRELVHLHFMTRVRRPAPPIPTPAKQLCSSRGNNYNNNNDDSGCSCEIASLEEETEQEAEEEVAAERAVGESDNIAAIPQPLKEALELAVLAATRGKRGAAASGGRSARKLRVRSNAHLIISQSVLAWREQLLYDVNYCEDEEDMIVPVTDILRAQQIQEDNEVQQTQQTNILQRFKSASIGNLVDLPGEDDKKSIKNRMRMKLNSNVFRINRSPRSEKKSRSRRSEVNSLYVDDPYRYPLFGAPLSALELNMTSHPNVPRFVVDVCAYIERPECIEQDGLYRASGNKLLVDDLKKRLTHLYDPRILHTDDIHTLTSLLKLFFRELSAPLITQEAYERLGQNLAEPAAIERMRTAFDEMPEPNRSTLRFLIKHLTNVAAASASNRMPASNLAIVWGPCLLAANSIQFDIGRMNMLAKVLIESYDSIFRPDNERLVC
ncbi:uncharacterized protein LOC115633235 [Scaptodrosophila lebanonensis]|uniref:Uncharacterized protein LOC115633235 n=1 Tax=Drosophila lebanonensis TaxID=7225 RepID=A0A6J2UDP3_DROLE|nr:uncharacterized protein LOC115633235 [Scaptodrosophila lebanonensis]